MGRKILNKNARKIQKDIGRNRYDCVKERYIVKRIQRGEIWLQIEEGFIGRETRLSLPGRKS